MATMKPASSVDGLQLIKGEFGVGHWFEGVVEVMPPMHTPSPDSAPDSMTCLKHCCEVGHSGINT